MSSVLTEAVGEPPRTVEQVLDRLRAIQHVTGTISSAGPRSDGLAAFNHLYTTITEQVLRDLESAQFQDANFLKTLDVEFAKRYFQALVDYERDKGAATRSWSTIQKSRSWSTILESRSKTEVKDLQFAASGVNSHVNVDLPFALLSTWDLLNSSPGQKQHEDYLRVNNIFEREMTSLRRELEPPGKLWFDRGNVTHMLSTISDQVVVRDRDAAWQVATQLYANRDDRDDVEKYLDSLGAKINVILLHT